MYCAAPYVEEVGRHKKRGPTNFYGRGSAAHFAVGSFFIRWCGRASSLGPLPFLTHTPPSHLGSHFMPQPQCVRYEKEKEE